MKEWGLEKVTQKANKAQVIDSSKKRTHPETLLSHVMQLIEATKQACKGEMEVLAFSNETLQKEEAFIQNHFPKNGRIAYLNVGGQPIATHAATLQTFDDSMLGSLFGSQDWTLQEKDLDVDGNYCLQSNKIDFSCFQTVSNIMMAC